MIDKGDLDDALIHFLRDAEEDKAKGRTLARLFDMLDDHGRRIAALEMRTPSVRPPPAAARHRLESIAEVSDNDSPTLINFKTGELGPLVDALKFWSTLKSLAIGVLAAAAAGATVYAAFFKK